MEFYRFTRIADEHERDAVRRVETVSAAPQYVRALRTQVAKQKQKTSNVDDGGNRSMCAFHSYMHAVRFLHNHSQTGVNNAGENLNSIFFSFLAYL